MNTLFAGKNFIELAETDSTNGSAQRLLGENPPEGTVILARSQTAGRGQGNNHWHSAPGLNLTFSLILQPYFLAPNKVFLLNKAVSLAVQQLCQFLLPRHEVLLKWPNDILVDRKKIAGILIENQLEAQRVRSSVIGVGLNVNQTEFPEHLQDRATSLQLLRPHDWDVVEVVEQLLGRIEAAYLALRAGRTSHLEHSYLKNMLGYQEWGEFIVDGQRQKAMLVGVDPQGRLALQIGQSLRYFQTKEVAFCL